jgi:hypothetical protein
MRKADVDPWVMQEQLMRISGQALPETPTFNNTSILYTALILEEVAELMASLEQITMNTPSTPGLAAIGLQMMSVRTINHNASVAIRRELASMGDFSYPLIEKDAINIADDSSDIAVVNAGFILASGINGSACYNEVASSNLSKSNPESGVIDKDESGKWIKGKNFFKPDLQKVIAK